jgi:hypothetical protein
MGLHVFEEGRDIKRKDRDNIGGEKSARKHSVPCSFKSSMVLGMMIWSNHLHILGEEGGAAVVSDSAE